MRAQILTTPPEIALARRLVHDVYVCDMGWSIAPENPSGLRVEKDHDGFNQIRDRFENNSAIFGAFEGNALVGTIRIVLPIEGKLEVEHYHKLSIPASQRKFEVNRLAILREWNTSKALPHLIREVAQYLMLSECEVLVAALTEPEPAQFCSKLGFTPSEECYFKYNQRDPTPVRVYKLDCRKSNLEKVINLCNRLVEG